MDTEAWSEQEEPDIAARHLLLCRDVTWNAADPEARYSLQGLLTSVAPGGVFPVVWKHPIHAFVQFSGSPGEYEVWIELVRLIQDEDGEVVDETEALSFGPFTLNLSGPNFVHGRSFFLRRVPFDAPGYFEFRVRVAGAYDVLVAEHLFVEG